MLALALKAIFANLLVIVSVFGFGTSLIRLLPESLSRLTRSTCAFIGGFGILGLLLFLAGHVSLNRVTIGVVIAIGVAMAITSKLRPWIPRHYVATIPATIVLAVLSITALTGLAEPVGDWNYDGVAYHLVGPKVWLHNGVVRPIADNMPTSYPSVVEVVFTALYGIGGDRAPGLSAAWTLAMLLAIAASLGRRCGLDARGQLGRGIDRIHARGLCRRRRLIRGRNLRRVHSLCDPHWP